jgi:hypothetical protein
MTDLFLKFRQELDAQSNKLQGQMKDLQTQANNVQANLIRVKAQRDLLDVLETEQARRATPVAQESINAPAAV